MDSQPGLLLFIKGLALELKTIIEAVAALVKEFFVFSARLGGGGAGSFAQFSLTKCALFPSALFL